jgi:hypothetical protein
MKSVNNVNGEYVSSLLGSSTQESCLDSSFHILIPEGWRQTRVPSSLDGKGYTPNIPEAWLNLRRKEERRKSKIDYLVNKRQQEIFINTVKTGFIICVGLWILGLIYIELMNYNSVIVPEPSSGLQFGYTQSYSSSIKSIFSLFRYFILIGGLTSFVQGFYFMVRKRAYGTFIFMGICMLFFLSMCQVIAFSEPVEITTCCYGPCY